MKRRIAILLASLCALLCACSGPKDPYADVPNPIATITMRDGSEMRFELHLAEAPNTVANFVNLANSGFYDGHEFYRVISNVLIQAGDPIGDGTGHSGYSIKGEFSENGWENNLSHLRGTISMSRLGDDYNSASSQFFILQGSYPEYDGWYAAFGTATDDATLATIDAIASQPTDSNNVPYIRQYIETIRVNTHGYEFEAETFEIPDPTDAPEDQ